jgi:hypothetical protein
VEIIVQEVVVGINCTFGHSRQRVYYYGTKEEMHVLHNIETHSHNQCCRGKPIRITYSVSVCVVLDIQQSKRIGRTVLSSVACAALPCLSALSHNGMISGQESY